MKIVHVVETWIGGIASYVTMLMHEQRRMGHEIVLVCDPRLVAPKTFDTRNIAIVEYRSSRNPLMFASIAQTLHTLIGSQKANVIHCHSTYAASTSGWAVSTTRRSYIRRMRGRS